MNTDNMRLNLENCDFCGVLFCSKCEGDQCEQCDKWVCEDCPATHKAHRNLTKPTGETNV